MVKYEYTAAKSKNQRRGFFEVFYSCLVASDRLNKYFNADSRKSLQMLRFKMDPSLEDLYNGEGSLQANKTNKKH